MEPVTRQPFQLLPVPEPLRAGRSVDLLEVGLVIVDQHKADRVVEAVRIDAAGQELVQLDLGRDQACKCIQLGQKFQRLPRRGKEQRGQVPLERASHGLIGEPQGCPRCRLQLPDQEVVDRIPMCVDPATAFRHGRLARHLMRDEAFVRVQTRQQQQLESAEVFERPLPAGQFDLSFPVRADQHIVDSAGFVDQWIELARGPKRVDLWRAG
ncbi:MAG: hypothetical protein AW07_00243 [Candidatus Accumulibacter sp. SK-11]|nr:MAG: hypothetical protein AW07_00243 [Candidatus Accumulibacter sp. SK-11]